MTGKPAQAFNARNNKQQRLPTLISTLSDNLRQHFNERFGDRPASAKQNLGTWLFKCEEEIVKYSSPVKQDFHPEKMAIAADYKGDFKTRVFGALVRQAVGRYTKDPEFSAYGKSFIVADDEKLYSVINAILNAAHAYVAEKGSKLDYSRIQGIAELEMGFLADEGMFMEKIVGNGIRSELLHCYYPGNFPLMMRKDLYGLFLLGGEAGEFLMRTQERDQGFRVSHNWKYPYDRYTYIVNCQVNVLASLLRDYDLYLKQEYRFGYMQCILHEIYRTHKPRLTEMGCQ